MQNNSVSQSESIAELAKALVKAQAEMTPAVKDSQNPFLKTRYASLNSVLDACREPLLRSGIAVIQSPAPAPEYLGPNFIGLETCLVHAESGQWISSLTVIPLGKADPQAMGAALSYGRRYALSAMVGIVTEEDGDCERRQPERHSPQQQEARPAQRERGGRLPNLDGVSYESQQGTDGREYIVATGNTRENREALKNAGFQWNAQRSLWYKSA